MARKRIIVTTTSP